MCCLHHYFFYWGSTDQRTIVIFGGNTIFCHVIHLLPPWLFLLQEESWSHSCSSTVLYCGGMWQRELGTLRQQDWRAQPGLLASLVSNTLWDTNKLACVGAQPMKALLSRLSPNQVIDRPSGWNSPQAKLQHKPPPQMSLTPREMASSQASDILILSLTSLGNSSAPHEEVMDLSPMPGEKYGLI